VCTTLGRVITNSTCNSATGKCSSISPGKCRVDCDCPQGLLCANGACIAGFVPAYCCTKAGCPANTRCTYPNGSSGYCPGTNACALAGGYCTVQFTPCRKGYTLDTTVSCGGALALRCCLPNTP
jgi:hypothetical protein